VQAIDTITARKLNQATPKEREIFVKEANRYFENQNIYHRLNDLTRTEQWNDDAKNEYELCDQLMIHGMLLAETRTRKIKTTPWSPTFGRAVNKKSFWKIALTLKTNHTRPNDEFMRWAGQLGIEDFKSLDISTIKANLRKAQKEQRDIERKAAELRDDHLRSMLTESELQGDTNRVQKRLKVLIRAHAQKQHFRHLKNIFKPQEAGGLAYILVPRNFTIDQYPYDPQHVEEWEPIHDPAKLQEYIQHRNIQHFGQADGTPFTTPPLDSKLQWHADTIEAQEIMEGTVPLAFVTENPYTKKVIEYIANRENLHAIDTYITADQISRGFRKWRESTSTSPSGCHLGLRRITTYPMEDEELEEARKHILKMQTDIVNLPIQNGFSPYRWQTVVNAMLEKIPGKPYLHKLRVIHILEADYNLALKEIFGRRLLWNCERYGKLGDIQDGFRKDRSTIRTLLHNEIINDYNKRLRLNNFVGMTDISGCFDRIVAPVISLLNKKNGCPQEAVTMHATTLQKARYHLKTKHETTTTSYSHSSTTPIYGNGQGTGDSPSQWCQQSTMLFDLYSVENPGATMSTRTGDKQIQIPLAAFADDTNLLGNDDGRDKSIDELIQQAQHGFTSWNELLHATGHFMELDKCACYLLIWSFQEDGYAFTLDPTEHGKQIEVKDITGKIMRIKQLSATTSQKLLGVMKNPIGNQHDEIDRLRDKSNTLAVKINSHALS
jgi:hypothetical protein